MERTFSVTDSVYDLKNAVQPTITPFSFSVHAVPLCKGLTIVGQNTKCGQKVLGLIFLKIEDT
jgi:hypothetical protein